MHSSVLLSCVAGVSLFVVLGCAVPNPNAPVDDDDDATVCSARREVALKRVQAAVEANRACTTDADCVHIAVQTECFDSCTQTIGVQGKAAVDEAKARANQTVCASYKQDHCPFTVPPCAPPSPPACRQGLCE